jgi:hypothetical protein
LAQAKNETYTAEGPISYWNAYVAVTQMGGQANFSDPRLGIDVKHSPDLASPLLLARADFGPPGSTMRAFVVVGAAPAFRLSARGKASFRGEERAIDTKDAWKPLDLGLVGGLGVEFGRALIEGRYTHGITHINEDDNGDDRIKNRVFSVAVGFRLR